MSERVRTVYVKLPERVGDGATFRENFERSRKDLISSEHERARADKYRGQIFVWWFVEGDSLRLSCSRESPDAEGRVGVSVQEYEIDYSDPSPTSAPGGTGAATHRHS